MNTLPSELKIQMNSDLTDSINMLLSQFDMLSQNIKQFLFEYDSNHALHLKCSVEFLNEMLTYRHQIHSLTNDLNNHSRVLKVLLT